MTVRKADLELLTIQQVADMLNVSHQWVRKSGIQKTYLSSSRHMLRYKPEHVAEYLRRCEEAHTPKPVGLKPVGRGRRVAS